MKKRDAPIRRDRKAYRTRSVTPQFVRLILRQIEDFLYGFGFKQERDDVPDFTDVGCRQAFGNVALNERLEPPVPNITDFHFARPKGSLITIIKCSVLRNDEHT